MSLSKQAAGVSKRGFTVTRTPMSALFQGAHGELRSVRLGPDGQEAADGIVYYCVQDAIQYVCDISEKRASNTWNEDINMSTKALISTSRISGGWIGLSEFVFHRQPLTVVTFDSLMVLITHLNSGKASDFKMRFADMFTRVTAGDQSLHAEVDRNLASTAPLNAMARGELPPTQQKGDAPELEGVGDAMDIEPFARMPLQQRSAYIADLERKSAAAVAFFSAQAELVRTQTENTKAEAEAASAKAAALVNETEALARKSSIERLNMESEQAHKRQVREEAEELGEVIKRFAAAPPAERETQRYAFAAQLVSIIPSKRTRDSFVAKLIKAPAVTATAQQRKAGVYVLKFEDGTYYVGESQDTDARVAQHIAGEGASCIGEKGATAVRVNPYTQPSYGELEMWERAETLERMFRHGIEKVRGWIYTTAVMSPDQRESAFQQICSCKKLCGKCGRSNHFSSGCFANAKAVWATL